MFPCMKIFNITNCMFAYMKVFCNYFIKSTIISNGYNIGWSKFVVSIFFTLGLPSFLFHVFHIAGVSFKKKMIRIYTRTIITFMAYKKTAWNSTKALFVNKSMQPHRFVFNADFMISCRRFFMRCANVATFAVNNIVYFFVFSISHKVLLNKKSGGCRSPQRNRHHFDGMTNRIFFCIRSFADSVNNINLFTMEIK